MNLVKITTLVLSIFSLIVTNVYAQKLDRKIHYKVAFSPIGNKTDLKVKISTQSGIPLKINELKDKFGTSNIHKYVYELKATNGKLSLNKDSIIPDENNKIQLEYRLSFDVEKLKDNTYSPNISKNNFHAFNCQWMINLGDNNVEKHYYIQIEELPKSWDSYNSYMEGNTNINILSTYNEIFDRVLGAAHKSRSAYFIKNKPLDIFIHGDYELDKQLIINSVKDIITKQREFFNDFNFDFFNVIILPKDYNVAGINVSKNTFVCYLKNDVTIEQLSWIVAHEVFHTWLGKKIDIKLDKGSKIYRDHWFTEGFTDYFAYKIRLDAGIINLEQFKDYINGLLRNIADNSYSNYTLSELETLASSGGYGTEAVKLQYYRGALIALNLEAELLESNSTYTLGDILNEMLLEAKKGEGIFSRTELFTFFRKFDLDLEPLFNLHIVQGETIKPKTTALGSDYKLVSKPHNVFDFGFNYYQSREKGIVRGVDQNSEAYKVGLRDGQKFIDLDYTNRFGAAWEESDLVTIKISELEKEKELKYLPKGQKISILQYELK